MHPIQENLSDLYMNILKPPLLTAMNRFLSSLMIFRNFEHTFISELGKLLTYNN